MVPFSLIDVWFSFPLDEYVVMFTCRLHMCPYCLWCMCSLCIHGGGHGCCCDVMHKSMVLFLECVRHECMPILYLLLCMRVAHMLLFMHFV